MFDIPFREIFSHLVSTLATPAWFLLIVLAGWSGMYYGSTWLSPYIALVCVFGFVILVRRVTGPSWEKEWLLIVPEPLLLTLTVGTIVALFQTGATSMSLTTGLLYAALIVELFLGVIFFFLRDSFSDIIRLLAKGQPRM